MKTAAHRSERRKQAGVALLIAIFVLLLISVVAIALLVSSGTETALGANYRASSTVYYAALAGLEEARGRLLPKNPDYLTQARVPSPFLVGQPLYMINQLPSETVAPWDSGNTYYDKEYANEFTVQASAATWQSVNSVWSNNAKGIPGPAYKWVRITAATERSLNLDVNSDGSLDSSVPIYYNPSATDSHGNPAPGLMLGSGAPSAVQVLQITALAALPNGSQKLLQYVVYPTAQALSFPAAMTFDGPNVGNNATYPLHMPEGANFVVHGTDDDFSPSAGGSCGNPGGPNGQPMPNGNPNPQPVRAVGYANTGGGDTSLANFVVNGGIQPGVTGDYIGSLAPGTGTNTNNPNVFYVGSATPPSSPTLDSNFQTLAAVNTLISNLSQQADVTLSGPITQSDATNVMPSSMSPTNPVTVVVNGNLTENGWTGAGYGTLIVTGVLDYDPNSSWYGVILVVGKGVFYSSKSSPGTGRIYGAVLVATTLDASGNPITPSSSPLGSPTADFLGGEGFGNNGVFYSSCWVQFAQSASKYQVLSFHEIPQS
jgi:hypothetical protein